MSVLYSFKGGVYYIHKGVHHHPKQTHILHSSRGERARFEQIAFENPAAGPTALIAGRHGLTGTRESVATISTVLPNQDRGKSTLPAEEENAPVKCHPSLPAEECAPVKRRRASKRVQRWRKRN
jgi:hypothetical protein